ncbi:hypothetical protein L0F63_002691 [Massospora cicadina]|nr:hypothetical protein L0F63_002691 [Massospora cicadina]
MSCLSAAIDVYDGWIEQIESNTSGPRSTHVEVESFKEQDRLGDDDDLFGGFDDEEIATYTKTTRLADQDDAEPDSRIENEELFGEEDIESELPENEHQKTTELDDSEDDFISSSRERVNSHRNRHLDDLESEREKHAKPQRKNVYIDSDEE